jgi:hypothetical protein
VLSSSGPFNFILFAGTPETVPSAYWDVITMAGYNSHQNQIWYAYTTDAYPMLLQAQHQILEQTFLMPLVLRQLVYAPSVWFGFVSPQHQEAYGHEYSLLADLVAGVNARRDAFINAVDTALWAVALLLVAVGSAMLMIDRAFRWRYLPLLCITFTIVFINFAAAWTRMLLPAYPVLFIAMGVALTWGAKQLRPALGATTL